MSLIQSAYQAPSWIPGGHMQTILPAEVFPKAKVEYRREIWETPDSDIIAVDIAQPEPESAKAPVMVHFHGLEGSSQSHYARALMAKCVEQGVRGMVIHYRGCGGIENKKPRAYFAGDVRELDWVFVRVRETYPDAPVYSMGVSLGANNVLFWAGNRGPKACEFVDRIVSVCSPLDLVKSNEKISKGFSRIYEWNFIATLKNKALAKNRRYPGLFDEKQLRAVCSLSDFDNAVTAPLHGFRDAADYWTQCSSLRVIPNICVPTLILNAKNDPIVGDEFLPKESAVPSCITLEYPDTGGHCGFPQPNTEGSLGYLPKRTLEFCFTGR